MHGTIDLAERDCPAGWTFETLRIHLLSIMNEREKAHDIASKRESA